MAIITLKNWFQLDFVIPNVASAKATILKIDDIIVSLQTQKIVSTWFFLFEGDTVRVRMSSTREKDLQTEISKLASEKGLKESSKLPFSPYQESDEMMFNEAFVTSFANIMSETTKLTIAKLRSNISFDNYRVMERLQHCMFNNLLTLGFKTEEHFLQQRLLERIGQPSDKDFENKL